MIGTLKMLATSLAMTLLMAPQPLADEPETVADEVVPFSWGAI
jgi:hypothetical protein